MSLGDGEPFGAPKCLSVLSILATATERVDLMSLVASTAYGHPAKLSDSLRPPDRPVRGSAPDHPASNAR